jgi:hypothetical protein
MAREPVFFSFHFDNDVFRTQQIRNIGAIDGKQPVSANDWEQVKRKGDAAIEKWIEDNMAYTRCVVVLIGSETANRKWVRHEIRKAWQDERGMFGIYIHNLKDPNTGTSSKGANPFDTWRVGDVSMASLIQTYDLPSNDAYGTIARNLQSWVDTSIMQAKNR